MPVYETGEVDPLSKAEQLQALRDARALLGPGTWRQDGSYGYEVISWPSGICMARSVNDEGCYCVVGAIAKALELDSDSVEVQSVTHPVDIALQQWLSWGGEDEGRRDESYLTHWNDFHTTTLADVHELLDRTVALLESTGGGS